jgi:hypothetical protein
VTNHEEFTMNDSFGAARIRREELDRQIDSIRAERLLRSASTPAPGIPTRARAGLGRGLISLGTALLGAGESAGSSVSRGGRVRA